MLYFQGANPDFPAEAKSVATQFPLSTLPLSDSLSAGG